MTALVVNGWTLFAHPLLLDQIDRLEAAALAKGDPQSVPHKILAWLESAIFEEIPRNPGHRDYWQGKTLGKDKTHWFRDHIGGRFRLFFRFDSAARIIVFAWINDEDSLRTYGSKTDAYAVFRKMLDAGDPPNDWDELLKAARGAAPRFTGKAPAKAKTNKVDVQRAGKSARGRKR